MIPMPPLQTILPALAIVLIGAAAIGLNAGPLSLATDVGHTDEDVCQAVTDHAAYSLDRLDATGFPRASTSTREIYQLTRNGEVEARILIDWGARTAECLPLDGESAHTASLDMTGGAYQTLVDALKHVLATGEAPTEAGFWKAVGLWWGTSVSIPENPDYAPAYTQKVYKWAAGTLASGELE